MSIIKHVSNLVKHPGEMPLRVIDRFMRGRTKIFVSKRTQEINDRERDDLFRRFGDITSLVDEARQVPTFVYLRKKSTDASVDGRSPFRQTSSFADLVTMYVLIRLLQPRVMVETGVYYGGFSSIILYAMKQNGFGQLYSIDLPVEGDGLSAELRGSLVPDELRQDWQLILGDSRVELPKLLYQQGQIDAFNHDSVHTTSFMSWEYETAWPYIRPGGFISSHDVLMSRAWGRFLKRHESEIEWAGRVFVFGMAQKRPYNVS